MENLTIICLCGKPFIFTIGEQRFYKEKGYVAPKRCRECRRKKRQERLNSSAGQFRDDDR